MIEDDDTSFDKKIKDVTRGINQVTYDLYLCKNDIKNQYFAMSQMDYMIIERIKALEEKMDKLLGEAK